MGIAGNRVKGFTVGRRPLGMASACAGVTVGSLHALAEETSRRA